MMLQDIIASHRLEELRTSFDMRIASEVPSKFPLSS